MLSTDARPATGPRRLSRQQRTVTAALSLAALCAQLGCAQFTFPTDATSPPIAQIPPAPLPVAPGSIRIRLDQGDLAEAASPTVVYLATDRGMPVFEAPTQEIPIGRSAEGLSPAFAATAVNQSVRFRVVDDIHHHIFSKSEVGAFDLGPLGKNESKRIRFSKPGMRRLYCSLHPAENAALYVAPSPYFAQVPESGEVVLDGLLPGHYRVHAWSESGRPVVADVEVRPGAISQIALHHSDPDPSHADYSYPAQRDPAKLHLGEGD
jgi:plastocyanin